MDSKDLTPTSIALALALAAAACSSPKSDPAADTKGDAPAKVEAADSADSAESAEPADAPTNSSAEIEGMLAWLHPDPLTVVYDRVDQRLDPAVVNVVFGLPHKAGDLLTERATLDEALDIAFDEDAKPATWLGGSSLGFTIALSKTPYFLRPRTLPKAEVDALLTANGFTADDFDGTQVWFPKGSFPWRIALLEGDLVAFIPVDVPGAGLEPLMTGKASETSEIESQLITAFREDPSIQLVMISGGPLLQFDVSQTIAQLQFGLAKDPVEGAYVGRVVFSPVDDVHACAKELQEREHPEENQQVQALLKAVQFEPVEEVVIGQLRITSDTLKHFLAR